MEEEISGYIENIVFIHPENGFTVARLKEPHKKELTSVVGCMPSVQAGESLICKGSWTSHPHFGKQFSVTTHEIRAPSDVAGIQKYLESGLIRGIGPIYAKKIVQRFGSTTLDIIDQTPHRLLEIEGLGKKRLSMIEKCWKEQRSIREVMIFLRSHDVSPTYAQKIFKTYGEKAIALVKDNPYQLARDIFGIGFKMADAIAQKIGFAKDSLERVEGAIEYTLWELSNAGHTCFPKENLLSLVEKTLEIPQETVEKGLFQLIEAEYVICSEKSLEEKTVPFIWLKSLWIYEKGIAKELFRIRQSPLFLRSVDVEKAIEWVQNQLKIDLAVEQKRAVSLAIQEKIHILTGGPGTGKSTITNAILRITEKLTQRIILAAPTGRAAKRMSQITRKKAFTIHALLEFDFTTGKFKKNRDNPLQADLIIIDEASMIDTKLMYDLLCAIPDEARVIFVGDIDQLPSVGPGFVLKDLITSNAFAVTTLQEIFRQAKGSKIIVNAHRINQGLFPDTSFLPHSDFQFIEMDTPEEIEKKILSLIETELPQKWHLHPIRDIQVLSPMKRGIIGTENLNQSLQQALNPSAKPFFGAGRRLHVRDKVMQIRNNYDKNVYNGDVGTIQQIHTAEQMITISFDGKIIKYDFSELEEIVLAYAVSIHKYQGSECPCIILPMHTCHYKLLHRNLLYTGITRGKKRVILIGMKKAISIAVKNDEVLKRHTGLTAAIKEKSLC